MHMLSLLIPLVTGHPSGLAGGRASCGLEFNTPQDAYIVQDAREAWYLRRIQTCEAPFFWTTFSTVKYEQDVLISVLSPEVDRFADKFMWKAVIFNDNLPELTQKELDGLPDALIDLPGTTGMVIMSDVDKLSAGDCSFVDNRVMKQYADEVTDTPDGKKRCMELLDLRQTYVTTYENSKVLAGNTWRSWWMYSYDHKFFHVGDYRMVSWIEARDSPGTLVSGRYEITIAPHIWYGYAPDEMMRSAHDQISTCTCGANYPLYSEQATTRVGWSADDAKVLFENENTYGECSATGPTDDDGTQVKCFASTPSVDTNAILEWGGRWSLAKGSYTWTLRAEGNDVDGLEYHEPKMDVFVVKAGSRGDKTSLDVNHRDAQVAISGEDQKKINAGGTIAIAMSKPGMKQTLVLDNSATTTTYKLEIDTDGDYLIYTEHMPWEFAAMVLEDTAPANPDSRFIWAVEARDYVVTDTQAGVAVNTTTVTTSTTPTSMTTGSNNGNNAPEGEEGGAGETSAIGGSDNDAATSSSSSPLLPMIVGVVVGTLILIVGIVLFYRSKSTIDRDVTFVNDVEVKRRPKKAGSRPRNRPPSSWMQDASRTDAETLLKGCRSGTFLVRARNDTSYAFSVIIRNRVVHKLITEAAPGEFTVDGNGGEWGSSLESVVAVVSLQMGTKYECAMYPLSAAAKQPETPARRPIRGMANAQPRTSARNDTGTRANATTGEQTYEEIDDGSGDAAMHEKTYEEIDESGSINNAGVYETAFTLNADYSTVQESAAAALSGSINNTGVYETAFTLNADYSTVQESASAALVSQQSVQVRRISGYEITGARANRGPDVPVVTINPHYHNDDATNDPTAVQHSTSDPYASLHAAASPYGTNDGAAVDFDYDDTDDSDCEV